MDTQRRIPSSVTSLKQHFVVLGLVCLVIGLLLIWFVSGRLFNANNDSVRVGAEHQNRRSSDENKSEVLGVVSPNGSKSNADEDRVSRRNEEDVRSEIVAQETKATPIASHKVPQEVEMERTIHVREFRDPITGVVTQTRSYDDDTGKLVKHGVELSRYADGQKRIEVNYSHGKRDGLAVEWYPDGQRKAEINFKDGKLSGQSRLWFSNGQLESEGEYKDDKKSGRFHYWDTSGKLIKQEEYRDGVPDGAWVINDDAIGEKEEGTYKDGFKHGEWTRYFPNGKMREKGKYEQGIPSGEWTAWSISGNKQEQGKYRDGKKCGVWTNWYENAEMKRQGEYQDDKKYGVWTSWYENAEKESQGEYQDDMQNGEWLFWHDNGQKKTITEYRDGIALGLSPSWDREGTKLRLLKTFDLSKALGGNFVRIGALVFTPDNRFLIGAVNNQYSRPSGRIYFWDLLSGQVSATIDYPECCEFGICLSEKGDKLAVAYGNSYPTVIDIVDVVSKKSLTKIKATGRVERASKLFWPLFNNDATVLATYGEDRISLWNVDTGDVWQPTRTEDLRTESSWSDGGLREYNCAFTPDASGRMVCSALQQDDFHSADNRKSAMLQVWNVKTGKRLANIPADKTKNGKRYGIVKCMCGFNGNKMIACYMQHNRQVYDAKEGYESVGVWDVEQWKELSVYDLPKKTFHVSMGNDDQTVTIVRGRSVIEWLESESGQSKMVLDTLHTALSAYGISSDGEIMASGGDNEVKIWDVK